MNNPSSDSEKKDSRATVARQFFEEVKRQASRDTYELVAKRGFVTGTPPMDWPAAMITVLKRWETAETGAGGE